MLINNVPEDQEHKSFTSQEKILESYHKTKQEKKNSVRQTCCEMDIRKSSVHFILRCKWKTCIPIMVHAINDDLDQRKQSYEWYLKKCEQYFCTSTIFLYSTSI